MCTRTVGPEPEYLLALGEGFNLAVTIRKTILCVCENIVCACALAPRSLDLFVACIRIMVMYLQADLTFAPTSSQITKMKVWELEALTDAHFKMQTSCDKGLEDAGIDTIFHATLISAGLDLETLRMASDDRRYLACELEKAGISRPGDRVKIVKALMAPNL